MTKPSPQVAAEANNLETMIDALPLYGFQRTKVWDCWSEKGMPAAMDMLARYKASYKETGDALDQAYQALRVAYDAGDAAAVQGALQQLTTVLQAPPVAATAKLGDSQKPIAAKAARPSLDTLMDGVSAALQRSGGH